MGMKISKVKNRARQSLNNQNENGKIVEGS